MYQVVQLISRENILDAEVIIQTFDNLDEALKEFNLLKECLKAEFEEFKDIEKINREDKKYRFSLYCDNLGVGAIVEVIEVDKKIKSITF